MAAATIKLFLPHGDAKGLRTAEISNWTGKALAAPRTEFEQLLAREECEKAGVYVLTGSGYDAAKGQVTDPYLRWVVYTPYATPESTGLSTKAGPGPWLMYPGTPGAHIMISPPKK